MFTLALFWLSSYFGLAPESESYDECSCSDDASTTSYSTASKAIQMAALTSLWDPADPSRAFSFLS